MAEKSELLRVPAFADLPDDQIAWFIGQSEELHLKGGETYIREGDPADAMFIVLEGQLQGRGEIGGETVVFSMKPGDVTGVLPFSRMKQFPINARAVTDARDRLASLGKLSAGLAHELNNPASAAKRATSQLRDVLKRIRDASHELGSRD